MKEADIFIYDVIGGGFFYEGVTAKSFLRQFKELEKANDRINVHINSPGGDVWEGLAIANTIAASKKEIHTYNDGLAGSMGFTIFMSGHTRHAAKNSINLIHNVSGSVWGNAQKMREAAQMIDAHDEIIAQSIADRSGLSIEDVKAKWLDYKDHFLTSKDAFDEKLIDVLEDYTSENIPENVQNLTADQLFNHYSTSKNKETFVQKIAAKMHSFQNSNNSFLENNPDNMFGSKFKKLSALVDGVKNGGEITTEDIDAVNNELEALGLKGLKVVDAETFANVENQLPALEAKVTDLEGQISAANTAKTVAEAAKATAEESLATATESITALTADRDAMKALAEKFGAKAGDTHTNPKKEKDEDTSEQEEGAKFEDYAHNQAALAEIKNLG